MLKLAVLDDDSLIANEIENRLLRVCKELNISTDIDVFVSGEEMIRAITPKQTYHIVFLDIAMEGSNGIDVSRYIRDKLEDDAVQIVYISGENSYDRLLFEFRPFHFVAKPIDDEKIRELMQKYIRIFGKGQAVFEYRIGHEQFFVELSDVLYLESDNRKIKIKTKNGENYFYGSLKEIIDKSEWEGFLMPHTSFWVNNRYIKAFHPTHLTLINGEEIPVSKAKRKDMAIQILKLGESTNEI